MVTPNREDPSDSEVLLEVDIGKIETLVELKQAKAQAKTIFTKSRRSLLVIIQEEKVSTHEIKGACEELDLAQEGAMEVMTRLLSKYIADKDYRNSEKLSQEIEKLEIEYTDAQNRAQETFDEVVRKVNYSKLVRRMEDMRQESPSDSVQSESDQIHEGKSLYQSKDIQKSETDNSKIYKGLQTSEFQSVAIW